MPSDRTIGVEEERLLKGQYSSRLAAVSTSDDAIELLEMVASHPHITTINRIKDSHFLIVDGNFEANNGGKVNLVRAFCTITRNPKIIKFTEDAKREQWMYNRLGFNSDDEALACHLVPLRYIEDARGKKGLVMPAFHCSLDTPPYLNEVAIIEGVKEISKAVEFLHSKGIIHNDIKPGNILLDSSGKWFLCDYGSCYHDDYNEKFNVCFTTAYVPLDFKQIPSMYLDWILIVVTALVKLGGNQISDLRERFRLEKVVISVEDVKNIELRELLEDIVEKNSVGETK